MACTPQHILDLIYEAELKSWRENEKKPIKKTLLPEQAEIIQHTSTPILLVNAGAGSGKTETMSQRIVWLILNGYAQPSEILGLTFTRKAAGELAARIRKRLHQLSTHEEVSKIIGKKEIAVDVATYHSYAGSVLREYGILNGIESESDPVGDAEEWMLAYDVISKASNFTYNLKKSPRTVVNDVLALAAQIQEHQVDIRDIHAIDDALLTKMLSMGKPSNEQTRDFQATLEHRYEYAILAKKVIEERQKLRKYSFDDQMALAAHLASSREEIGIRERSKFKYVFFDEYQDTSVSQVQFLKALFGTGTHSLTAVGDPNQSIYGWRGAAQGTIKNFKADFNANEKDFHSIDLMVTWRNDEAILNVANKLLGDAEWKPTHDPSKNLRLRHNPITPGEVCTGRFETEVLEAEAVAKFFKERFVQGKETSCAVLVRTKSQIPEIENALIQADLPVEVIGLGGLIHTPEVADVLSLLRTLLLPDNGTALMRLLAGPRLALGPADIKALGFFARELAKKEASSKSKRLETLLDLGAAGASESDDYASGSIIDALDQIDKADREKFSTVGFKRLQIFSQQLAELRSHLRGSIVDALIECERFLRLDVEVLTRYGLRKGRANLDAFLDEAANFEKSGGTLLSFLEWLDIADDEEGGLKPTSVAPNPEAIQILTIHTSKGSEWDYVAIPGISHGTFPTQGKKSDSWLKNSSMIPHQLRKDDVNIDPFEYKDFSAEKNPFTRLKDHLEEHNALWKERRIQEEYRLGYVAFTRAARSLFVSHHIFAGGVEPKDPSPLFLIAESQATVKISDARHDDNRENPNIDNPKKLVWPNVGKRAKLVRESADYVRGVKTQPTPSNEYHESLLRDAKLLIAELTSEKETPHVYLPTRMSVSALIAMKQDPQEFALSIRRPMPRVSGRYARTGTDFHSWIEKHLDIKKLSHRDQSQYSNYYSEEAIPSAPIETLAAQWMKSEWASKTIYDVEEGFETVVEGVLLRGRIDAIFKEGNTYEVVDWKTGSEKSGEDLSNAAIQLAMYRLAFSKLHDVPLENISAAFYYVGADKTIRPADLLDEAGLKALIAQIPLI